MKELQEAELSKFRKVVLKIDGSAECVRLPKRKLKKSSFCANSNIAKFDFKGTFILTDLWFHILLKGKVAAKVVVLTALPRSELSFLLYAVWFTNSLIYECKAASTVQPCLPS